MRAVIELHSREMNKQIIQQIWFEKTKKIKTVNQHGIALYVIPNEVI